MRSSQRRILQAAAVVAVFAGVLAGPVDDRSTTSMMKEFGVGASPAAADSDDHGRVPVGLGPAHTSWGNACTGVPDEAVVPIPKVSWGWWPPGPRIEIVDFLVFDAAHACSHHDDCYIYKRVQTRNGNESVPANESGRAICDSQFLYDMYEACDYHSDAVWACEIVADFYYLGVRWFGTESWENSSPCTSWRGVMDQLISHLSRLVGQPGLSARSEAGLLAQALAELFSTLLDEGDPYVDSCRPWHGRRGDWPTVA